MSLTKQDLAKGQCSEPFCDHHDHTILYLNPTCHLRSAGVNLSFNEATGDLTIACDRCWRLVAEVAVVRPKELLFRPTCHKPTKVEVQFDKRTGKLSAQCVRCKTVFNEIEVR